VRLHRQRDQRPFLIVEGPSDVRILQRAFADQDIVYFPANTRSLALEAAEKLEEWRQLNFACVVDRDFDVEVEEAEKRLHSVHPYENADMEAMLAVSKAGIDLLLEIGSSDKIDKLGGVQEVIIRLMEILEPVTRLRRANAENQWGLAFDKVDLSGKIDKKSMVLKLRPYCTALHEKSEASPGVAALVQYADGTQPLSQEPVCPRGSRPYFRGRDFLVVLGAALCGYCGTKRAQSVTQENLEGSLRLAGAQEIRISDWGRDLLQRIGVTA
jgi:5S rRNA maturation endonuclease (ribonuclease M5)